MKLEELDFRTQLENILASSTLFQNIPKHTISNSFSLLIGKCLENSKVLQLIQKVQLLDDLDIEVVYAVYLMLSKKVC